MNKTHQKRWNADSTIAGSLEEEDSEADSDAAPPSRLHRARTGQFWARLGGWKAWKAKVETCRDQDGRYAKICQDFIVELGGFNQFSK